MRRLFWLAAACLVLIATLICGWSQPAAEFPLAPGETYAVSVVGSRAVFDLPLVDPHEQYLLVVSNIAPEPVARQVRVAAEPVEVAHLAPLARVERMLREPLTMRSAGAAATARSPVDSTRSRGTADVAPTGGPRWAGAISTGPLPGRAAGSGAPPVPAQDRNFWLPVGQTSVDNPAAYRAISTRLAGVGPHVSVYVDRDDDVAPETVDYIVQVYERSVRPRVTRYFGLPLDIDGDGRFAIVITGWLDRLEGGSSALGGMVRPSDFDPRRQPPFSNRADVLYLNSKLRPGQHLETLLAHELVHAVVVSARRQTGWTSWLVGRAEEETWLNEALAHLGEHVQSDNWSNLDYRVARCLSRPASASVVVPDYRRYGLSRDPAARGATYLFLRWCVEQHGPGLLARLVDSRHAGIGNLEAATGQRFDELYRQFAVDLFLRDLNSNPNASGLNASGLNASGRSTSGEMPPAGEVVRHGELEHDADKDSALAAGLAIPAVAGLARRDEERRLPPLDLYRPLGRWGLAGPRTVSWNLGRRTRSTWRLSIAGTASQYLVVAPRETGPQRITIEAQEGCQLQVSLLRLPDEMGRLELRAIADPAGWRLALTEHNGQAVTLTHVAWEADEPSAAENGRQPQQLLTAERLYELFDDPAVAPLGRTTSRPLRFDEMPRGRLLVRAVGIDSAGHRVAAWTTLDLSTAAAWRPTS